MAHVNLLPWRTERRKLREREFYMHLVAAFVVGLGALLVWMFWMDQRIDNQNDRNGYLQTEITQLDVRIAKIKDLEKVREHLLARKQIIEQLQADRSQMVHLFDELVKTIPTSARLTGLKQSGQSMSLDGVAQSNDSVAKYMRNIESSPWMGHADLGKTENLHDATRMPYGFGLKVQLNKPKTDEVDANKMPVSPAGNAAMPEKVSNDSAAPASPREPTAMPEGKPSAASSAKGGV